MPGSTSFTASTARPPTSTTRSPTSFACSTMPPATRFTRASGDCERRLPPDRDAPDRFAAPPEERFVADPPEDEPLRVVLREELLREELLREVLLRDDPLRLAPDFRAAPLLLADAPLLADPLRELEPLFDAEPRLAADPRRVALPDDVLRAELLFRAAPPVRDAEDLRADDVLRALDPERVPVFAAPLRLLLALFAPLRAPLLLADFDRLPAPLDPLRFRAAPPDRALPPLLPDRPLFAVLRLRADFDAVAMCVLPVGGVCVAVQDSRTACIAQ